MAWQSLTPGYPAGCPRKRAPGDWQRFHRGKWFCLPRHSRHPAGCAGRKIQRLHFPSETDRFHPPELRDGHQMPPASLKPSMNPVPKASRRCHYSRKIDLRSEPQQQHKPAPGIGRGFLGAGRTQAPLPRSNYKTAPGQTARQAGRFARLPGWIQKHHKTHLLAKPRWDRFGTNSGPQKRQSPPASRISVRVGQ